MQITTGKGKVYFNDLSFLDAAQIFTNSSELPLEWYVRYTVLGAINASSEGVKVSLDTD